MYILSFHCIHVVYIIYFYACIYQVRLRVLHAEPQRITFTFPLDCTVPGKVIGLKGCWTKMTYY